MSISSQTLTVVIGCSAGGLTALKRVFAHCPQDSGLSFVVLQHVASDYKTHLHEILKKSCPNGPAITLAKDDELLRKNFIYVVPSGKFALIENGRIKLHSKPPGPTAAPHTIDDLFCSAAKGLKNQVAAILLSGTGRDGTLGLSAIRDHGGLTLAQDDSAEFSEMPSNAIKNELVDLVLPPEKMLQELISFRDRSIEKSREKDNEKVSPELLSRIIATLKQKTSVDFSNYRTGTIIRRLSKRVQLKEKDSLESYVDFLESDQHEAKALYDDLLINVTGFFRDAASFDALKASVLPAFLNQNPNEAIRVWVPACSSGEEAYSLAILLKEFFLENQTSQKFVIFGTDIDEPALKQARDGQYSHCSVGGLTDDMIKKYFDKVDNAYHVKKEIRELCVFARQDISSDPPFSNLDLISCRNLFIYFNTQLQKRILKIFNYALKPGRFLFLGSSESITGNEDFTPVNKEQRIFQRTGKLRTRFSMGSHDISWGRSAHYPSNLSSDLNKPRDLRSDVNDLLLPRLDWARLVVNDQLNVIFSEGPIEKFLQLPAGNVSLNLLKMARAGLGLELRAAIKKAKDEHLPVSRPAVLVSHNHGHVKIDLEVIPFKTEDDQLYLLLLREVAAPVEPVRTAHSLESVNVLRTEQELIATREFLQSLIEQHESVAEELRSANEEIIARNEELQSANEELETTKEELQAGNEELSTLNEELSTRNLELNDLNEALKQTEEKYRAVTQSASDAIVTTDSDGFITMWNKGAEIIFGTPANLAISQNITDKMPARYRLAHTAGMRRVAKGGERRVIGRTIEIEGLRSDGTEFPIELSLSSWEVDNKTYFTAIIRDISERIWAQKLMATRIELGRLLLQVNSIEEVLTGTLRIATEQLGYSIGLVWKLDATQQILKFKAMWPSTSGTYEEIANASKTMKFAKGEGLPGIAWEQRSLWIQDLQKDPRFVRKEAFKPLSLNTAVAFSIGSGDDLYGIVEMFSPSPIKPQANTLLLLEDIGSSLNHFIRRKLAEEETQHLLVNLEAKVKERSEDLFESEARHRFIAEASAILVSSINYESTLQNIANLCIPTIADWCVVGIFDHLGVHRQIAVAHRDQEKVDLARRLAVEYPSDPNDAAGPPHVLKTGKSELVESIGPTLLPQLARDDRHWQIIKSLNLKSYICVPLIIREKVVGTITLIYSESNRRYSEKDLSLAEEIARRAALAIDRSQLMKEAQSANQAKDEFLATLSHELRTPMNIILGWVEILRRERDEKTLDNALDMLERNSLHQIKLISDLLDISRIISGKLSVELKPSQLTPLLQSAASDLKVAADVKGVKLKLRPTLPEVVVPADVIRLQQVFQNIISNAIKFTPPGGEIEVSVKKVANEVQVIFKDNGMGIHPNFVGHVFDAFKQEDGTMTRSHGGLGLGLAISRYLITQHNGRINVSSDGKDKGTTFTVILPALNDSVRNIEPVSSSIGIVDRKSASALGGVCILAIDDSPDILQLLDRKLKRWGAIVSLANSAEEASQKLSIKKFDIVICDIGMPKQDGISFMRELRSKNFSTPAIALTAYARKEEIEAVLEAGFDLHVAKPVTESELLNSLTKVLADR